MEKKIKFSDLMKKEELLGRDEYVAECKNATPVLDAYFASRTSGMGDNPGMGASISDPKTTEEIVDDLSPIADVYKEVVINYLMVHGYELHAEADGNLRWDIWRYVPETDTL